MGGRGHEKIRLSGGRGSGETYNILGIKGGGGVIKNFLSSFAVTASVTMRF